MAYAIDTDGAGGAGDHLARTATVLKHCAEAFAYAGGQLLRGIGRDDPFLSAHASDFVAVHQPALYYASGGFAALGQKVSWVADATQVTEMQVVQALGAEGHAAPLGSDGTAL